LIDEQRQDYEELICPIENQMIRSVWRITRNREDAEEAFQEALLAIWKGWRHIRRHPNPRALVLRICINSAYDALRHRARRSRREELGAIPETLADPALSPSQQASDHEQSEEVLRAIGRLPRNQGQAILMKVVQELPYGDIAAALNCREVTARKHVARARAKLRGLLAHLFPSKAAEAASYER
jgi:RNA polymerase sigma-70 factor (ECF subfamily)